MYDIDITHPDYATMKMAHYKTNSIQIYMQYKQNEIRFPAAK